VSKFPPGRPGNAVQAGKWTKGVSANPGGKVSLRLDLERAGAVLKQKDEHPNLQALTPADARARWWAMILPVAFAGPCGPKDTNWTYASAEVGTRLLGKPKETIAIEDGNATPIDWSLVPEERRPALTAAILELQGYLSAPSDTEH
jgi:hypothetical protein